MDATETTKNVMKSVTELKTSYFVLIIFIITLLICLTAFINYFYYSRKKNKNCDFMESIYGDLN